MPAYIRVIKENFENAVIPFPRKNFTFKIEEQTFIKELDFLNLGS